MAFRDIIDVETVSRLFLDGSNAWFGFYLLASYLLIMSLKSLYIILMFPISILFMLFISFLFLIIIALVHIMLKIGDLANISDFRRSFIFIFLGLMIQFFDAPYGYIRSILFGFIYPVSYLIYSSIQSLLSLLILSNASISILMNIIGTFFTIIGFVIFSKSLYELSGLSGNKLILTSAFLFLSIGLISPLILGFGLRRIGDKLKKYLEKIDLLNEIRNKIIMLIEKEKEINPAIISEEFNVDELLIIIIYKELIRSGVINSKK